MTEPEGSGAPDLDALIAAREIEWRKAHEAMLVSRAEGMVAAARLNDLTALQQAAKRRWSAAKGRLTKSHKDGDAAAIAAAQVHCDRAFTEFTRISDQAINEALEIPGARMDSTNPLLDQARRTLSADAAATDALSWQPGDDEPTERGSAP